MSIMHFKFIYTAVSVNEQPVYVKKSVNEGYLAGFAKVPYEINNRKWNTNVIANCNIWKTRQIFR